MRLSLVAPFSSETATIEDDVSLEVVLLISVDRLVSTQEHKLKTTIPVVGDSVTSLLTLVQRR